MTHKSTIQRLALLLILFVSISLTVQSQYILKGSASASGNDCYVLTPNSSYQAGSVWYQDFIDISEDFDMTFQVYLGTNDDGADGIAFVLQSKGWPLGGNGGGLGYYGISPSIEVEIDTWSNTGDPSYDHMAIHRNGDFMTPIGVVAGPVQASSISTNIEDGAWHSTQIVWDATSFTLTVYFDNVLRLIYTDNIVANTFGGNPAVGWGFTGGTGAAVNLQQFCLTSLDFEVASSVFFTYAVLYHCDDANLADVEITAAGGTPPYQHSDDGGTNFQVENVFTGEATGDYIFLVKDANDYLSSVLYITIPPGSPLALVADPLPATVGNCNGSVNLAPSGGNPPYIYSLFSYPFSSESLNASLFTIRNGNFSEGGGSLRGDNLTGLYTGDDNSIVTSVVFSGGLVNSFEASFKFDFNTSFWFGFTENGNPLTNSGDIAHGFLFEPGQLQAIELGTQIMSETYQDADIWLDFKIVLTDAGAEYFYKESSSDTYYSFGSGFNPPSPELKVGAGYRINGNQYGGFNTRNWVVTGDVVTTGLCPGTYDYTVYDACGSFAAASATVTEVTPPVVIPISPWTMAIAIFLILAMTLFRYRKSF